MPSAPARALAPVITALNPSVTRIRLTVPSQAGWEQWLLLRSDTHWDNPHCDRALEKRHLDLALKRRALILDCGDLFCAMQGKYDKRSSKQDIRPEHADRYLDSLVETAIAYYAPYAKLFAVIGRGNHEMAIRERHETDLTDRLCAGLRRMGSPVVAGGYTHWVDLAVERCQQRCNRKLWWTHGYGGGGPVTQDTIQAHRQRAYIENADIMLSGHTHDSWMMDTIRLKLNRAGQVERRSVYQLKLPTYKDAYADGRGAWEVQRGMPPKPLGAYWLRLYWDGHRGLQQELTRAS